MQFYRELGQKPWQWPCVEDPRDECPYPKGSVAAEQWRRDRESHPERFELFEELSRAIARFPASSLRRS